MKKAIIYARYSSDSQTEQSIEGQLRVCREYAQNNDILIVDTYIDRAMTGTNDNRVAFQKMLKDSSSKEWQYLIVYKLDRFSRNKFESVIHKKTLRDNGVTILSAMENLTDSPEGRMMETVLEGFNQYFSEELTQKVNRGLKESWRKGKATGGQDIFGYAIELRNEYFNIGYLLSYGAYVFGNNNTDDKDIGIAKGNAVKGAKIMWELAGVMDEKCIDDSFTNGRAPMLANGTIFATITTPDITSQFLKEMSLQYQKEGLDQASADAKAKENLVITGLPKLPKDGDITTVQDIKNNDLWIEQQTMGGVNGYAVSSYTKNRDWAVKFVEFATGYEMVKARADMLGVVAARSDVIAQTESLASQITYRNLDSGVLEVMPSISAVKQIWTPISSGFKQIATDGCGKRSFDTAKLQSVIEEISSNIYKAIHTFA